MAIPKWKFLQTIAPGGSATNKFYIHNDIFCNKDDTFEDSEAELDNELEDDIEVDRGERGPTMEPEEKVASLKSEKIPGAPNKKASKITQINMSQME